MYCRAPPPPRGTSEVLVTSFLILGSINIHRVNLHLRWPRIEGWKNSRPVSKVRQERKYYRHPLVEPASGLCPTESPEGRVAPQPQKGAGFPTKTTRASAWNLVIDLWGVSCQY